MTATAFVYILTTRRNKMLYVGATNNLMSRVWEHRTKQNPKCFTARYKIYKLVYYEEFSCITEAIAREKQIKGKSRKWKDALITAFNPLWVEIELKH
jgi:putative endonuclease